MFYNQEKDDPNFRLEKNDARKILGDDLYFDLMEIEPKTLIDQTLIGFFER